MAVLALLVRGALADDPKPAPPPPAKKVAPPPGRTNDLSAEDQALVKDLTLVCQVLNQFAELYFAYFHCSRREFLPYMTQRSPSVNLTE